MELSFWSLFLHADLVVKFVIFVLIAMSVWTWAVLINREIVLRRVAKKNADFNADFWAAEDLNALFNSIKDQSNLAPQAHIFVVGMAQWLDRPASASVKEIATSVLARADRSMQQQVNESNEQLERYIGTLANIASSAPFIGLFGTVWGVMNAFIAIGHSGNTSLVSVAPGIAEALFATALGLVAAIPASITYNALVDRSGALTQGMENFAQQFSVMLARQLEWS